MNENHPSFDDLIRSALTDGEPDVTFAITPVDPTRRASSTQGAEPLPTRRSLREAGTARRGRRAASTGLLERTGVRRMLWASLGVSAAASALIIGALTTQNAPRDVTASVPQIEDTPWVDDALNRELPPNLAGPSPLVAAEQLEPDTAPDEVTETTLPPAVARPPAGASSPQPAPVPKPSPNPSPSPTPDPTPSPEPEPEPEPDPEPSEPGEPEPTEPSDP